MAIMAMVDLFVGWCGNFFGGDEVGCVDCGE